MNGEVAQAQQRADERGRGQGPEHGAGNPQGDVGQRLPHAVVARADVVELADELDARGDGDERDEGRATPRNRDAKNVTAQQRHGVAPAGASGARANQPAARPRS